MWIGASNGYVPAEAFVAGKDGSTDLYVGRARYNNAFVPGKVHPAHGTCYIPWGGKEISLKNYEVLCGTNFEWTHSSGGNIPQRAIPASSGMDGEVMYIGRVHHNRTITVGKVHPSHGVCYIPYGGEELSFPNYEILLTRYV
ncbi:natterin-4-like [Hetaerina americana]|uniref:natterin-4-like n=1 Tax=Hetaerina americana TaxID=62018 RepID=UPI003A7F4BA5